VNLPIAEVNAPKGPSTAVENSGATPKGNGRSNGFHTAPPLDRYHNPPSYYPMPHINSVDAPPKLDTRNFTKWQGLMKTHISSASTHFWRIIQSDFSHHDPYNLTAREEVEEKLNATTKHLIHQEILIWFTSTHLTPPRMFRITSLCSSLGTRTFSAQSLRNSRVRRI
jgi:hypothetical protein